MLIWLILAGLTGVSAGRVHKYDRLPARARALLPVFEDWSRKTQIPLDVLLTWTKLESNFTIDEYNPEPSAVKSWACEIARKPEIWGRNPAYAHAVEVCQLLEAGASTASVMNLWGPGNGFGSYGLLQVARIVAHEVGVVPAKVANARLFDVQVNMKAGTAEILDRKARLFPGRAVLLDVEWAWVRAAYVGGPRIFNKAPDRAIQIARTFLTALQATRKGT